MCSIAAKQEVRSYAGQTLDSGRASGPTLNNQPAFLELVELGIRDGELSEEECRKKLAR
jgi:hypothetical protein